MRRESAGLQVSASRIWDDIEALSAVGATPAGGCERLALTEADREGRELFSELALACGLTLRSDPVGNVFARRRGTDSGRPPVLIGSHLDTQYNAGRFDGTYGVVAGLEVVRTLNDAGWATKAPIDIVVWTNEEGARFPEPCAGSAFFAGLRSREEIRALTTAEGVSFGAELDRLGLAGDLSHRPRPAAYFEAHIEQGPLLESESVVIGAVAGIRAIRRIRATFEGAEAHAGSPMLSRRDALRAAARLIDSLGALPDEFPGASVTVGQLDVEPNTPSVVPGRAHVVVDLRPPELSSPDRLVERAATLISQAVAGSGVDVRTDDRHWSYGPMTFDPACVDRIRRAAEARGHECRAMVSAAGHDAGYVSRVVPTAMVFVPCRGGISHAPDEWAEPEHLAAGGDVLLDAVLETASPAGR